MLVDVREEEEGSCRLRAYRIEKGARDIIEKASVELVVLIVIVQAGIDQVVGLPLQGAGVASQTHGSPVGHGIFWYGHLALDLAEVEGDGESFQP